MTEPDKPLRSKAGTFRPRISTQFRRLAELMVQEGVSIDVAAARLGANLRASRRAFSRPHNRAYFNRLLAEIRENAAQSAYLRVNSLSQTAESERVRFDASRWVAGVDGIAPVQRVDATHSVHHTFGGYAYPTIDGTPDEPETD